MSNKTAARKQRLLRRSMSAPIWLLARVRNLYFQSLTGSGSHMVFGNAMGCPTPKIPSSPGKFSVNSSPSNYKTVSKVGVEFRQWKSAVPLGGGGGGGGGAGKSEPRTRSVRLERIEEDKAFDCGEGLEKLRWVAES